jgi:hypothetical protein
MPLRAIPPHPTGLVAAAYYQVVGCVDSGADLDGTSIDVGRERLVRAPWGADRCAVTRVVRSRNTVHAVPESAVAP